MAAFAIAGGVLLVLVAGLPIWLAAGIGAMAFWFFSKKGDKAREGAPRIDAARIARSRDAATRKVLDEATVELKRLLTAGRAMEDSAARGAVGRLGRTASDVVREIEAEPGKLMRAQRLLTYYLPRAADIAEAYAELERQRTPDLDRQKRTHDMLIKLEDAFQHYADTLKSEDMADLDVDLRLLESALKRDLER